MWLTDIFNMLFPPPKLGKHPDDLRRDREDLFTNKRYKQRVKRDYEKESRTENTRSYRYV